MLTKKVNLTHIEELDEQDRTDMKNIASPTQNKYNDACSNVKVAIEGVGADAPVVVNAQGGMQSKSPMAMHLVDPTFLFDFYSNKAEELEGKGKVSDLELYNTYKAIAAVANMMQGQNKYSYINYAMDFLCSDETQQIVRMAKVLQYGADRYEANNWRKINEEEHINHALIHLIAQAAGDTQDDHIDHALCRLMMAYATEKSEHFNYNTYIPKG